MPPAVSICPSHLLFLLPVSASRAAVPELLTTALWNKPPFPPLFLGVLAVVGLSSWLSSLARLDSLPARHDTSAGRRRWTERASAVLLGSSSLLGLARPPAHRPPRHALSDALHGLTIATLPPPSRDIEHGH
ncbi:hypothetical protein SAMD00023353_2500270 [Rosellinia necatrix]|uniref:Uncharacterized protein n=1 Tax=Rosellinia necatrix TaxID=77044 RepID=A0A1S8A889_ROSNE|nr:hypothetical protein SAMD00023353_2500270 [Rosellinia necatrix]